MTWIVLAGSLAAVLTLAGLAWVAKRRRKRRIETPEAAADAAEATLAGFATVGAAVGADGAAALVVDREGRVAVCKRRGAGIAVREVGWDAIRAVAGGMRVDTGERWFGTVTVTGIDALDSQAGAAIAPGGPLFPGAQPRLRLADVIPGDRHREAAARELELVVAQPAVAEGGGGAGEVELPHAEEALVVERDDLGPSPPSCDRTNGRACSA